MSCPTSSRLRAALLALSLALVATSTSTAGVAAPSASDKATARQLVADGRKLRAAKQFPEAIEKLAAAYALYATPVTGHELALVYRDAGRFVEAREAALGVAHMAVEADEGKASAEARAACNALIAELGKKIGEVILAVDGYVTGATVVVTFDGTVVPLAALSAPRLVDPGNHVVAVTATGSPDARVEFSVASGEHKRVEVHVEKAAQPPIPVPVSSSDAPTSLKAPPPEPTPTMVRSGAGWLTYVGFSVAGAGALVGSITGLQAFSAASHLSGKCDSNRICPASEDSDVKKLNTTSTISTISFALAGVGLGAALFDLATSATAEPKPAPNATPTSSKSTTPTSPPSLQLSLGAFAFALSGSF